MSQNSVIFGALFVGFLVYITIRGSLAKYVSVFTTKNTNNTSPGTAPLTGTPSIGNSNNLVPGSLGRAGVTNSQAMAPGQAIYNWITGQPVAPPVISDTGTGAFVDMTSGF